MGSRTTLLLLLLVVATGSYLWRDPESRKLIVSLLTGTVEAPTPVVVVPLVSLDPNDVLRLEIEIGGERLEARKSDGRWPGYLNGQAIEILVDEVGRIGRVSEIEDGGKDLEQYGLATPAKTLWLHRDGGAPPIRIDFGRSNPALTGTYTRVDQSGPVILAGAALSWELDNAIKALRQP